MPYGTVYQPPPAGHYCGCTVCRSRVSPPECDSCGTSSLTLRETVSGDELCSECATDYYGSCDDCERLARDRCQLNDTATRTLICDDCAANYWGCDDCGELISQGDYCADCEPSDDYDDGCSCEQCCSNAAVHGYSYKPAPEFHGDGPLYLGIELEIESSRTDLCDCVRVASDGINELGYLKEDSSLSHGFEIVTHPMSHKWASQNFPFGMLRTLTDNGAVAEDTAGLHVHVSRAAFDSPAHIYRWLKLIYRNEAQVTRIARRSSDQWAPFAPSDRRNAKDFAKGDRNTSRYAAVNVTNADTFELRVFASTLDEQELRTAMDLAAASVEYTRTLTVADIARRGGWKWSTFGEWVTPRAEYAALSAEMSA